MDQNTEHERLLQREDERPLKMQQDVHMLTMLNNYPPLFAPSYTSAFTLGQESREGRR